MAQSPIAEAPSWHACPMERAHCQPFFLLPGKSQCPHRPSAPPLVLKAQTCDDTLLFSWPGRAGQGELAGGAGLVLRRLAPGPTPLPAGRLGQAAAWTSSKAQQGPLCAAASLSPSASTRPSGASVPFCVPERRGGGRGEETHFSGQLSFQLRGRRSLR